MVKKFLLVIACLLSILLGVTKFVGNFAQAETISWARIVDDEVYLYSTADNDKKMFALEKSYYVEILDEVDNMYFVAVMQNETDFPRITGFVYKAQVTLCDIAPIAPYYPTEKVTVIGNSATIRLSPLPTASAELTATNTQRLSYYGKRISNGITWYFVYYGGCFGYVEASAVTTPNIILHPTPLPNTQTSVTPTPPAPTDPIDEPTPSVVSPTSEILLIVFVVVLAVGLTLALFLPGNIKKKDTVFEQDI